MAKAKNGLVTLQVNECDVQSVIHALDSRVIILKNSKSELSLTQSIELSHLRDQFFAQAKAQGWKPL